MSIAHFFDAGGYLDYGDAVALLPVEELRARVYTHRDAECALRDAPADSVLAIRPTGLASSYALTQRPLTAIEVASLDDELRNQIDGAVDVDLAQFELIQVGRATTPAQNRSLAEF
ncbi:MULTISPECIES: hypothetical protein [Halobacteriales]|uniref:DUF8165 domain-containing protein n=1 Tax=Halosegnis rubeus TaxID=2212850 RepID=A0A5N5U5M9_9EURY|nr:MULTISPECIES: hypothetical protein [Halobacteriales]KAB7513221.1 hypothetical protein DMP03_12585 [Halosegnis rubeus]MDL0127750.1 hypothetical protein [Halobacterium salinarum]